MQNTIQNQSSVRFGSGILSFSTDNGSSWINLGGIKDTKILIKKKLKEMVLDNARMPPKVKIEEITISATLYEVVLANINSIEGFATLSTTAGSSIPVTNEAHGTGWTIGTPIKLNNKNGANTIIDLTTAGAVKAGAGNLVRNTDFRDYVADGTNGVLGFTYIVPVTAQTLAITANYTYTPLAQYDLLYKDVEKFLSLNRFKFVNTDANGKEFGVEFYKGYNKADTECDFQSDDSEDAMGVKIEIKAYPDSSNQFMRFWDQQTM